jgi:hypothetical protein
LALATTFLLHTEFKKKRITSAAQEIMVGKVFVALLVN